MSEDISNNKNWWQPAIDLFAQISAWIVAPIIVAVFLGKYLDDKYDKSPWFLLVCVGVAFIITNVGLVLNVMKAAKKIDLEAKKKNKD